MLYSQPVKHFTAALIGVSLCLSPTVASATPVASAAPVSPMIALSVFGSPISASAVRPVVHAPTAANLQMSTAATAAAVQDDNVSGGGAPGWVPLAIFGVAFLAVMYFIVKNDNGGHVHVRPTPPPVSPD